MNIFIKKPIAIAVMVIFVITSPQISGLVYALDLQEMPKPGVMVTLSPSFTPALIKGMVVHKENPLSFDFIINPGELKSSDVTTREEYKKLIKYFLAALTIPETDQWVNLSPYEKDRMIKKNFGSTLMGRDLLAQDYLLKQITSSLMYPESGLGKIFWDRVYAKAQERYGNINLSVNAFNKVWIVPQSALVNETGDTAYIVKSHLRVLLESDYLAMKKSALGVKEQQKTKEFGSVGSRSFENTQAIMRDIILPELEREINEGKNFAPLRQVFSAMILATWFKQSLKESMLAKAYANQSKVKGVLQEDVLDNERIYQQYLQAFKKGAYNYIKEEMDQETKQIFPRKYFAGGVTAGFEEFQVQKVNDRAMAGNIKQFDQAVNVSLSPVKSNPKKTLFIGDANGLALTTVLTDYDAKRLANYAKKKELFFVSGIFGNLVLRKVNPGRIKGNVHIPLGLRKNSITPKQEKIINGFIDSSREVVFVESSKGLVLSEATNEDKAMARHIYPRYDSLQMMRLSELSKWVDWVAYDERYINHSKELLLPDLISVLMSKYKESQVEINAMLRGKAHRAGLWEINYREKRDIEKMIEKITFSKAVGIEGLEVLFLKSIVSILDSTANGLELTQEQVKNFERFKQNFMTQFRLVSSQEKNGFHEIYDFWFNVANQIEKDLKVERKGKSPYTDSAMVEYRKPTFLFWSGSSVPLSVKLIDHDSEKLSKFAIDKIPLSVLSLSEEALILEADDHRRITIILSTDIANIEIKRFIKQDIEAIIGSGNRVYISKTARGFIVSKEILAQMPHDANSVLKQRVIIKYPGAQERDWIHLDEVTLGRFLGRYISQLNDISYREYDPQLETLHKFLLGEISLGEALVNFEDKPGAIKTHQRNYIKSVLVSVWISIKNSFSDEQQQAIRKYLVSSQDKKEFRSFMRNFTEIPAIGFEALKEAVEIMDKDQAMRGKNAIESNNDKNYKPNDWQRLVLVGLATSDKIERFSEVVAIINRAKNVGVDDQTLLEMNRHLWLAQAEYWISLGNVEMARDRINMLSKVGPSLQLSSAIDFYDSAFPNVERMKIQDSVTFQSRRNIQTMGKPISTVDNSVPIAVDHVRKAYETFNTYKDDPNILERIKQAYLLSRVHKNEVGIAGYIIRVNEAEKTIIDYLKEKESLVNKGGIDMNSSNVDLYIKRDAKSALTLNDVDMTLLSNFEGFEPHIITIMPALSHPVFQTPVAK